MSEFDPLGDVATKAEEAGLQINDVLERAGVDRSTWWRWREERFSPRVKTLERLYTAISELSGQAA